MKLKRLRQSKRGKIEIIPMIDIMFFFAGNFYVGVANHAASRYFAD